jgi:DNA repair exonuclease SbcCD ATPase subunit
MQLDLERNKAPARAVLPEIDVSAQVGELFSANKVFQDDLFAQIAFLQKDIVEAREANVEAVEEMMGEKAKLRERIEHLKHEVRFCSLISMQTPRHAILADWQLDEAKSRATRSEIQAITESEHNLATMTILDSKLSSAIAARDTAEGKVVTLERAVEKLREEKENAQIVATERSSAMRHAEVS